MLAVTPTHVPQQARRLRQHLVRFAFAILENEREVIAPGVLQSGWARERQHRVVGSGVNSPRRSGTAGSRASAHWLPTLALSLLRGRHATDSCPTIAGGSISPRRQLGDMTPGASNTCETHYPSIIIAGPMFPRSVIGLFDRRYSRCTVNITCAGGGASGGHCAFRHRACRRRRHLRRRPCLPRSSTFRRHFRDV